MVMAGLKVPEGATEMPVWPKTTPINKLTACLEALGMEVSLYELGGGQLAVLGVRAEVKLALEARYDLGLTPTGKPSSKFLYARVADPIGIVVNLEFDYTIGPKMQKEQGIRPEPAKELGDRRNREYNDGGQAVFNVAMLPNAAAMNEWLDDWLDTLKVDHKRQSAKKKAKPTDLDLMMGATWAG